MTQEEQLANRERFEALLRQTGREGVENVIDYLRKNDFYALPSSLHRHHNWEGGLAQHCLGVYDRLSTTGKGLPQDSVALAALLHDICKARKIYRKDNGRWAERHDSQLYFPGHGLRSLKLLENLGLRLTPEEKGAIRWHMGGHNLKGRSKDDIRYFFANKNNTLWRLLMNADRYSASKGKPRGHANVVGRQDEELETS